MRQGGKGAKEQKSRATNEQVGSGRWVVVGCLLVGWLLGGCVGRADALERVLESGVLRVAMDASFPPFEYVDDAGNLVGLDVDLGRELAARLGEQGVEAQFIANVSYDGLYDVLTAGHADVAISALYVDPTRMGDFGYSTVYFNAGQVLVAGQGAEIADLEELGGRTLAVEFGSEGDMVARSWQRRLSGLTVLPVDTAAVALEQVAAGTADAALVDHLSALTRGDLRIVGQPVTDEPYAVAVRAENGALLRAIDAALAEMTADGTLEALQERWLRGHR